MMSGNPELECKSTEAPPARDLKMVGLPFFCILLMLVNLLFILGMVLPSFIWNVTPENWMTLRAQHLDLGWGESAYGLAFLFIFLMPATILFLMMMIVRSWRKGPVWHLGALILLTLVFGAPWILEIINYEIKLDPYWRAVKIASVIALLLVTFRLWRSRLELKYPLTLLAYLLIIYATWSRVDAVCNLLE